MKTLYIQIAHTSLNNDKPVNEPALAFVLYSEIYGSVFLFLPNFKKFCY